MSNTLRHCLAILSSSICLISFQTLTSAAQETAFTVGLWGDMPYAKANDKPHIPALLDDINASDIDFSFYDGDIKDGSSKCTDDVYTDAIAMFNALKKPMFYIPGDNEWTDCHRVNNGGMDNLERLDHIRKAMFATSESFGAEKIVPERQGMPAGKFVENMRMSKGGAMFVGLNVPGSNNNKVNDAESCTKKSARLQAQCDADNIEYLERDKANIAWLKESFEKAKSAGEKGIMVVIQGDPGFDIPETEDDNESRLPEKDGYAAFLDAITAETKAFEGQVVLVDGDTHYQKIDRPLIDATHLLSNFTRVQTFGSPNMHWIKVTIDASTANVFTFNPMIVKANAMLGMTD
jgi:hypothetical protein